MIPIFLFFVMGCATSPSQPKLLYHYLDLNDDGVQEEFVAELDLCGTGGCEWRILNKQNSQFLGAVFGKQVSIRILTVKKQGYYRLRTYHKMGAFDGVVVEYEFHGKEYEEVFSKDISSEEYLKYFK
ncbi:MAG: hypothetical protein HYY61_06985 [Deltaproteobacteria bacterium]|nr:hypothetical protein [Deltaproteobacteria bacterium]